MIRGKLIYSYLLYACQMKREAGCGGGVHGGSGLTSADDGWPSATCTHVCKTSLTEGHTTVAPWVVHTSRLGAGAAVCTTLTLVYVWKRECLIVKQNRQHDADLQAYISIYKLKADSKYIW